MADLTDDFVATYNFRDGLKQMSTTESIMRTIKELHNKSKKLTLRDLCYKPEILEENVENIKMLLETSGSAISKYDADIEKIYQYIEDYVKNYIREHRGNSVGIIKGTVEPSILTNFDWINQLIIHFSINNQGLWEEIQRLSETGEYQYRQERDNRLVNGKLDRVIINVEGFALKGDIEKNDIIPYLYHELNHAYQNYCMIKNSAGEDGLIWQNGKLNYNEIDEILEHENHYDDFLINICKILYFTWIPSERNGHVEELYGELKSKNSKSFKDDFYKTKVYGEWLYVNNLIKNVSSEDNSKWGMILPLLNINDENKTDKDISNIKNSVIRKLKYYMNVILHKMTRVSHYYYVQNNIKENYKFIAGGRDLVPRAKDKPKTIIISERQLNIIKESIEAENKFGISIDDIINQLKANSSFDILYPIDDYEYEEDEENAMFSNREEMIKTINETIAFFNTLKFPLKIWRSIRVDKLTDINYEDLGISWSFEQDSAMRFKGNSSNTLLSAMVDADNVDWAETISRYVEDHVDGNEFNSGFYENEIVVNDTSKLENIGVDNRNNLDESTQLLNEVRLNWLFYDMGKNYPFKLCNPDFSTVNLVNIGSNKFNLVDNNGNIIWKYTKSRVEGSLSEYYESTRHHNGKKTVMRGSDHWSYYIITNYQIPEYIYSKYYQRYRFPRRVNLIFGTQQPIDRKTNKHYCLILQPEYANKITDEMLISALDLNNRVYPKGHSYYILLDRSTMDVLGVGEGYKSMIGCVDIDENEIWVRS